MVTRSISQGDIDTIGEVINFHGLDSGESEGVFSAVNAAGIGSVNNYITPQSLSVWTPVGGFQKYDEGNMSRQLRMTKNTSFDPTNGTNSSET